MIQLSSYEKAKTATALMELWDCTKDNHRGESLRREGLALLVAHYADDVLEVMELVGELQRLVEKQAGDAGARIQLRELEDKLGDPLLADAMLRALGFYKVCDGHLRDGRGAKVDIDLSSYLAGNVVPMRAVK